MKIRAKYKFHNFVPFFNEFNLTDSGQDYDEYFTDCWLIGVLPAKTNDYNDEHARAVISLGDGEVQVVPLSAVRITDESYFTAPAQERLIAKYAIDDNGYVTGENILGKEGKAIFKEEGGK